MKRFLCIMLVLIMALSHAACGESGGEPSAPPDEEVARAIACGIVPEEIQRDYDEPITFSQYTEMLTNVIALWDENLLPAWEEITAAAAKSNEKMHREDGILEMGYALVLVGHTEPNYEADGELEDFPPESVKPSWDYPLFPTWEEIGFPLFKSNYMWGGFRMCSIHTSLYSGKPIYSYDPADDKAYMQSPLSRADAIRAVLRFGETDSVVMAALKAQQVNGVAIDAELQRAIDYGFITEEDLKRAGNVTTCKDFCQLLSKAVGLYDPAAVAAFETEIAAALQNESPIYDYDQLMAIYIAACAMGIGETTNGDWNEVQSGARDWTWDSPSQIFADYQNKVSPLYDILWRKRPSGWGYNVASHFWVCGHFSAVSGKNILDYELLNEGEVREETPPMEDGPMTWEEAVRAALRLYESTLPPIVTEATIPEAVAVYTAVDERRETILNSPTTIVKADTWEQGKTYSGTAYYVSNDGSDSNDGLSPETPWQTLEKVNRTAMNPGDAVFFRRGDIWYGCKDDGALQARSGVTCSAYGEGAKPVFSGSIPGIAQTENWTLHSEKDGAKIWVYKDLLTDISGILMDNNSLWAEKLHTAWDGENYLNTDGTPLVLEEALCENLMFASLIDLTGQPANVRVEHSDFEGPLYLRCDEGNPGDVFSDIQIIRVGNGFSPYGRNASGVTADNLAFYYYAGCGFSLSGYQGCENTLIQNCEVGWCGGALNQYEGSEQLGYGIAGYSGCAIQMSGCDNRVLNSYIHDCDNKVFVFSIHYRGEDIPTTYEGAEMRGNLIERSGAALHLMNLLHMYDTDRQGIIKDLVFEDNYVMHTGEGWIREKLIKEDVYADGGIRSGINLIGLNGAILENVQIRNNVMGCSNYVLVGTLTNRENYPSFAGNTYMQYENGWVAKTNGRMIAITEGAAETIASELGDTTAKVILMK